MNQADHERWKRFEEAFLHLNALDPAERAAHLSRVREMDPRLAHELSSALAPGGTTFLNPKTPDTYPEGVAPAPLEGSTVGPYRLVRRLGEGGMGVVFEGFQPEMNRKVALKITKASLSEEGRQRFAYEVKLLAHLRHPGIAQIYDSGVLQGEAGPVPWFAMEYVDGARTLDQFADQEALGIPARIQLIIEACEAVQHAHDRGIIHRDLKPANVLVGEDRRVKVIDFGVARGTDETDATRPFQTMTGGAVGTVRYMSPEQAAGDPSQVDVRSDGYALTIMLYMLVCGRHPLLEITESLSLGALLDAVRHRDPVSPRKLRPDVPADLEAVILRGLEKDRNRRYPSAQAMADDLRAHLAGEPVTARVPSWAERGRRFFRRNRAAVLGSSVALAALITATALSTYWALDASKARDGEARRAAQAEARLLASQGLSRWVTRDLTQRLQDIPGTLSIREEILGRIVDHLDQVAAGETNPELDRTLGEGYLTVAQFRGSPSHRNLGQPAAAHEAFSKAEARLLAVLDQQPDDGNTRRILWLCRVSQANLMVLTGDVDTALSKYNDTLAAWKPLHAAKPRDEGLLRMGIDVHRGLAAAHRQKQDSQASAAHSASASDLARQLLAINPTEPAIIDKVAAELCIHAEYLSIDHHYDEALDHLTEAENLLRTQDSISTELHRASIFTARARLHENMARFDLALLDAQGAAELFQRFVERDPEDHTSARNLGDALFVVGNLAWRSENLEVAEDALTRSAAIQRQALDQTPGNLELQHSATMALTRIGAFLCFLDRPDDARPHLQRAQELLQSLQRTDYVGVDRLEIDLAKAEGHLARSEGILTLDEDEQKAFLTQSIAHYERAKRVSVESDPDLRNPSTQRNLEQLDAWISDLQRRLRRIDR